MQKTIIRKQMLALRKALPQDIMRANAEAATRHIVALPQWQQATHVLLYMPIAHELDTRALLQIAWNTGKTVLLPRCDAQQKGVMHVAICRSMDDLTQGAYGILEPDPARCPALDPTQTPTQISCQIALVPAVAFDAQGNRLGYGGGYYDRFLAHEAMAETCLVGFAHYVQIVDAVPCEPWDRTMHAVCTEKGVSWPKSVFP